MSGYRARLFRALHAEARKRGLDHDALHDLCTSHMPVHSMGNLSDAQLAGLYRQWTGKSLRTRAPLPRRGEAAKQASAAQIISPDELADLDAQFARRNLSGPERANFIRRQLRGRDQLRTRADWIRVIAPLRAMNRRDRLP